MEFWNQFLHRQPVERIQSKILAGLQYLEDSGEDDSDPGRESDEAGRNHMHTATS